MLAFEFFMNRHKEEPKLTGIAKKELRSEIASLSKRVAELERLLTLTPPPEQDEQHVNDAG